MMNPGTHPHGPMSQVFSLPHQLGASYLLHPPLGIYNEAKIHMGPPHSTSGKQGALVRLTSTGKLSCGRKRTRNVDSNDLSGSSPHVG